MKAFKKWTMILLALGMTVSVAACGGNNGDKSDAGNSENNQTSVTVTVGEELSETEFNAAVQALYSQTNLEIVVTDGEQEENGAMKSVEGKYSFADGKMYSELTLKADGASETTYTYVGAVDGTYYQWTSNDKSFWDYQTSSEEQASAQAFLESIFMWCNFGYFEFNNKTGEMQFTGLGSPIVNVKAVDGEIVGFRYEDTNGDWYSATITGGNASVGELPSLED